MKSTVVDESLSSYKPMLLFQRIPNFYKILLDVLVYYSNCTYDDWYDLYLFVP